MEFIAVYFAIGLTILGLMTLLWLVSLALKNSSIVDIFWGAGFVVANWVAFALTPNGMGARNWIIAILVTVWGLRLSLYILSRNWGKPEDFRYRAWRKQAGASWWWRSFFKVFLLQAVLLWLIAAPLAAAQTGAHPNALTIFDFVAIPVWLVGFYFEAAGDWQLSRFRADPANKGKVMSTGVWRYTRHPNYFGDATQWWAFFLVAIGAGGWWTIFSPVIMTLLLLRVSGATLLEKSLKKTKPGYAEYIATTSEFVPWFPRKAQG